MFAGPIFTRELMVAPRPLRHFLVRAGYITTLFLLMYTIRQITFGWDDARNAGEVARFGTLVFQLLALVQLSLVMFFGLLFSASNVSQEKDARTLLLLLITDLKNHELVFGKLLSSLLIVGVLIAASAPVFFSLQLLGGVSQYQIIWLLVLCVVATFAAGSWSTLVAYWRDKTFQTLAISLLGGATFMAILETTIFLVGSDTTLGYYLTLLNPYRTLALIIDPFQAVSSTALNQHAVRDSVIALTLIGIILNVITIARVRYWNPSRFVYLHATAKEDEVAPARTNHRSVWDQAIIWREICTRAYGRKIALIKMVYTVAAVFVGYLLYSSVLYPDAETAIFGMISASGAAFVSLCLVSIILANAQAVTAFTTERDGQTLELLLVTDVSPKEFIFGKLGGVLYNVKELILIPLILMGYQVYLLTMSLEQMIYAAISFLVLMVFSSMVGLHMGYSYDRSRSSIAASLGTMFFLFIGIFIFMILLVEARGSFMLQMPSFLVFILAGSIGLGTTLTNKNPAIALTVAAAILPFLTFYAITQFLLAGTLGVCLAITGAYGFATIAMIIPAISEFDVALGRSSHDNE